MKIVLRANPPGKLPYGGDSGFVFFQPATERNHKSVVLHNPTQDAVYRTRYDHEFVPAECYPGNEEFPQGN